MPRALVLVPPSPVLVRNALAIGPGYAHGRTPNEMRSWAGGLGRLYQVVQEDHLRPADQRRLQAWLATPSDRLSPDAQRVVAAHRQLLTEADHPIRGDLQPDGHLDLKAGRHRAHYIMEREAGPVPVWVDGPDADQLVKFRSACHSAVDRSREGLATNLRGALNAREVGRTAAPAQQQRSADAAKRAGDLAARAAVSTRPEGLDRQLGRTAVDGAVRGDARTPEQILGRQAVGGAARDEPAPSPERHLTREFGEQTRERGASNPERER